MPSRSLGLSIFATAYDPLDLAAESIDPLGFLTAYLALADRLLPGFTTVTSVPRYLPMLCAGLRAAERMHPRNEGHEPAKARDRRLEVLRNFEKVWALACGLAEQTRGTPAITGLRGIRYVQRFLDSNAARSDVSTGDFELLANQVRYGGIGTYGQMLEACHFVDWASLTLRPLGESLAAVFPALDGWAADRPSSPIAKDKLRAWGEEVCLEKMTASEAKAMREGLNGGLEAERNDDVRWICLRLLKAAGAGDNGREEDCLKRLAGLIEHESLGDARKAIAVRQLRVVVPLIEPLEQLYQSSLFLFDEVRVRATENPAGCTLASLDEPGKAAEAFAAAQRSEQELRRNLAIVEQVDSGVAAAIAFAMRESGITGLAECVATATTPSEISSLLLDRHVVVQSGKFDRGQRKAPWIRLASGTARLTSQRNELQRGRHARSWRHIARHPYRISAAAHFIQQCRIT
jgi:hypothetical protein